MSETAASSSLPELTGRDDLRVIVEAFYARVAEDDRLGRIFNEVAGVDWSSHLPKMVDFWEKALFRSGPYRGNPLGVHLDLATRTEMGPAEFGQWLELFESTVDDLYAGDTAGHLKRIAADMAQVMQSRITGTPIPFSTAAPTDS